eukprot:gnl/Dysnectes_brevis/2500_a2990_1385.p1 GENE.gnl/Dysnectes_brevis/2500_a2990_1385~~gnl/Dysnectes_brevis/2500_a2990_1385.p1  ORF type:complete len:901 (+),score=134.53 gnl/Dysnectes_brevis/2500_a2990_1385:176-2878(+)
MSHSEEPTPSSLSSTSSDTRDASHICVSLNEGVPSIVSEPTGTLYTPINPGQLSIQFSVTKSKVVFGYLPITRHTTCGVLNDVTEEAASALSDPHRRSILEAYQGWLSVKARANARVLPSEEPDSNSLSYTDLQLKPGGNPLTVKLSAEDADLPVFVLPVPAPCLLADALDVPAHIVIPWPCIECAGKGSFRFKRKERVRTRSQGDDPLISKHGDDIMIDELCLLRACDFVHQAYNPRLFHDPTVPLVGSTGVGKSLAARRACNRINRAREGHHAAYLCLPRVRGRDLNTTWPPTNSNNIKELEDLFHVRNETRPDEVLTHWVAACQALIVAMNKHRVEDVTNAAFDHLKMADDIYSSAKTLFSSFRGSIVEFTKELAGHLDHAVLYTSFIDEIGLFLNGHESSLPCSRIHLTKHFPLGRPLSIMRALRHASRNLRSVGIKVVIVPLGTEAGSLNCHDYPSQLAAYRPVNGRFIFECEKLEASTVFPPCVCIGPVQWEDPSQYQDLVRAITSELHSCFTGEVDPSGIDPTRYITHRPLWTGYLASSSSLDIWTRLVSSKIMDVINACPKGVFALLLAGLGPNISSHFSNILLRHGFARVTHHPAAIALSRTDERSVIDLSETPLPLVLRNPRDPVIAGLLWRLYLEDKSVTRIDDLNDIIRELLSLPLGGSGVGEMLGEPLAISFLLVARAMAIRIHCLEAFTRLKFTLPSVRFDSIVSAMESGDILSDSEIGYSGDVRYSFTHVVDLPQDTLTIGTIQTAYIEGVMFRMPPGTAYIDYLAVGLRGDKWVLLGIQVRTGIDPKELKKEFPSCLSGIGFDFEKQFLLVSLCRDSVSVQDRGFNYLDLKGEIVKLVYSAAVQRRQAPQKAVRMFSSGSSLSVILPKHGRTGGLQTYSLFEAL